MIYKINNLSLPVNYTERLIIDKISKQIKVPAEQIFDLKIIRRSIDARSKPKYIITVRFLLKKKLKKIFNNIEIHVPEKYSPIFQINQLRPDPPPVVIGAGPAGLMAALVLAQNGLKPVVYEQGASSFKRLNAVNDFLTKGVLDVNNNVLFGEGGAGLFSDGKLTARHKDRKRMKFFFKTLVECGAPESILYDAEPHLGTDILQKIIPNLKKKIVDYGGIVRFDSKISDISIQKGKICYIKLKHEEIPIENCILATGHSARNIYEQLSKSKVALEPKSFAVGVRVEFSQKIINQVQWGRNYDSKILHSASFRFARKPEKDIEACYTFCMCPGGEVIPCSSSKGTLLTNGMSYSKRSQSKGNAAFLVPVNERDFQEFYSPEFPELAGCFFQEFIEKQVYESGGANYSIPAARLSDFLENQVSTSLPDIVSVKRIKAANLQKILPEKILRTLKVSIPQMLKKFKMPDFDDVMVYAAETRSSSPVRILRNSNSESISTKGLYPCGEGSGYSGGIVSSAIDGIKTAEFILSKYF